MASDCGSFPNALSLTLCLPMAIRFLACPSLTATIRYRHLDPRGAVVALYAKGPARRDQSGFVVG
jgi:hypothetical protein